MSLYLKGGFILQCELRFTYTKDGLRRLHYEAI